MFMSTAYFVHLSWYLLSYLVRNGDQSIEGLKLEPSAYMNNSDNILSDSQCQIGDRLIKSQDSDTKDKEGNLICAGDSGSPIAKQSSPAKPLHIVWAHRW